MLGTGTYSLRKHLMSLRICAFGALVLLLCEATGDADTNYVRASAKNKEEEEVSTIHENVSADECQHMHYISGPESTMDTAWTALIKCAQDLTKIGSQLNGVMKTAHEKNSKYEKSYSEVYSALMYLQGPEMLKNFQDAHAEAKSSLEAEVKDVGDILRTLKRDVRVNPPEHALTHSEEPPLQGTQSDTFHTAEEGPMQGSTAHQGSQSGVSHTALSHAEEGSVQGSTSHRGSQSEVSKEAN